MKRVYISGKITGTEDYMERFNQAENELREMGYTSILNPAKVNSNLPVDFTHKEYMAVSIAELRQCNVIYLMKGYKESRGAEVEKAFAENKGMEILYQ